LGAVDTNHPPSHTHLYNVIYRNDRVFALPDRSPFEGDIQEIRSLPARAVEELEKFFEATDAPEDKKLEFLAGTVLTERSKR
jgi:hypothetical protein